MFDLQTILAVNRLAGASHLTLSRVNAWSPETLAAKRFSRRVALYARDARVPFSVARAVLTLKDRAAA